MSKPRAISGFPEWTPSQTLAEQTFLRRTAAIYESFGYTPLDTPAVERVSTLTAKGVVDKEIYALERLREESRGHKPPELGLRFDLTIPLARYVAVNYAEINFPFKRYHIAKVWRGERPQEGRFREFYQADIDVLAEGELPLHFDAEMPRIVLQVFRELGLKTRVRLNNRKLLSALYRALSISEQLLPEVLREADKLGKIGPEGLQKSLTQLGLSAEVTRSCLALAATSGPFDKIVAKIRELGLHDDSLAQGLKELEIVSDNLSDLSAAEWCCDLGIVRGLDYYTGTIYETDLLDHPQLGSICSGGRYENLAGDFTNKKLPGVGISIGVTRLLSYLFKEKALCTQRHCPTDVLVILPEEERRKDCHEIATSLRAKGISTEVYHLPQALKKQLRYADRKGIPTVLFPHQFCLGERKVEIKDLASGEQIATKLEDWIASR